MNENGDPIGWEPTDADIAAHDAVISWARSLAPDPNGQPDADYIVGDQRDSGKELGEGGAFLESPIQMIGGIRPVDKNGNKGPTESYGTGHGHISAATYNAAMITWNAEHPMEAGGTTDTTGATVHTTPVSVSQLPPVPGATYDDGGYGAGNSPAPYLITPPSIPDFTLSASDLAQLAQMPDISSIPVDYGSSGSGIVSAPVQGPSVAPSVESVVVTANRMTAAQAAAFDSANPGWWLTSGARTPSTYNSAALMGPITPISSKINGSASPVAQSASAESALTGHGEVSYGLQADLKFDVFKVVDVHLRLDLASMRLGYDPEKGGAYARATQGVTVGLSVKIPGSPLAAGGELSYGREAPLTTDYSKSVWNQPGKLTWSPAGGYSKSAADFGIAAIVGAEAGVDIHPLALARTMDHLMLDKQNLK